MMPVISSNDHNVCMCLSALMVSGISPASARPIAGDIEALWMFAAVSLAADNFRYNDDDDDDEVGFERLDLP